MTKVPLRNLIANHANLWIRGNKYGSIKSTDKTATALTGRKFSSAADTNWYLARMEVQNGIEKKYPKLAEKLNAIRENLDKQFGINRFMLPKKDARIALNKAVKELGQGEFVDINIK